MSWFGNFNLSFRVISICLSMWPCDKTCNPAFAERKLGWTVRNYLVFTHSAVAFLSGDIFQFFCWVLEEYHRVAKIDPLALALCMHPDHCWRQCNRKRLFRNKVLPVAEQEHVMTGLQTYRDKWSYLLFFSLLIDDPYTEIKKLGVTGLYGFVLPVLDFANHQEAPPTPGITKDAQSPLSAHFPGADWRRPSPASPCPLSSSQSGKG